MQRVEIPISPLARQILDALATYPPEVRAEVYRVLQFHYGHGSRERFEGRGNLRAPRHIIEAAMHPQSPPEWICPNCGQHLVK